MEISKRAIASLPPTTAAAVDLLDPPAVIIGPGQWGGPGCPVTGEEFCGGCLAQPECDHPVNQHSQELISTENR